MHVRACYSFCSQGKETGTQIRRSDTTSVLQKRARMRGRSEPQSDVVYSSTVLHILRPPDLGQRWKSRAHQLDHGLGKMVYKVFSDECRTTPGVLEIHSPWMDISHFQSVLCTESVPFSRLGGTPPTKHNKSLFWTRIVGDPLKLHDMSLQIDRISLGRVALFLPSYLRMYRVVC